MTAWAPGSITVRSTVSSAARPEANAIAVVVPAAAPTGSSSAARHSWSAVRVGLPEREYS